MRILRLLAAAVLAVGSVLVATPPAQAADAPIVSMTVKAVADRDGLVTVSQAMTYDFGSSGGHGPYVYWTTRQAMADDPSHWRQYDYQVKSVTSSTGAPVRMSKETTSDYVALKIGDPNKTVYGLQTYEITYTVNGIVNPSSFRNPPNTYDEINWNVIGTGWTVPIRDLTVTLTGPATVSDATCWTGSDYSVKCPSATFSDVTATYSVPNLNPGSGLTVVAGWPPNTFSGGGPILTERHEPPAFFNPAGSGVAAAVGVLGLAGLILAARRGRDQQYVGLTPGLSPVSGQEATVGRATKAPIAVQFTPPAGVAPGMLGTLIDEKAENRDVTATIVDLAVRGYLRFEDTSRDGGSDNNFKLERLRPGLDLLPYEDRIFRRLFAEGKTTTRDDLEKRYFGADMAKTRTELYDAVTQAGWFKGNPESVRTVWRVGGLALFVASCFSIAFLGSVGLGPLSLVGCGLGIGALVVSRFAPARTAEGHAVNVQAQGFRLYLETAEADQIKFEEGQDIFSKYLPYAVAFGCADRWAAVFRELAARGVPLPQPTWYVGPNFYYGGGFGGDSFTSMMDSLDSFSQAAATVQTSSSGGSSGFSGFSGGGGGVGGGGGGSW